MAQLVDTGQLGVADANSGLKLEPKVSVDLSKK